MRKLLTMLCAGLLASQCARADIAAELADAVDLMLARSLADPVSVIDYRVSGRVDCKLALAEIDYPAADCICYALNAKNLLGAYAGRKTFALQYVSGAGGLRLMPAIEITERAGSAACDAAGLAARAASNIADHVGR